MRDNSAQVLRSVLLRHGYVLIKGGNRKDYKIARIKGRRLERWGVTIAEGLRWASCRFLDGELEGLEQTFEDSESDD